MAEKTGVPLSAGKIPNTGTPNPSANTGPSPSSAPKNEPSEFDKFVANNIGKAIIGTPTPDGGIKPITAQNNTIGQSMNLELPAGLTPEQTVMMQSAFKAITSGQAIGPINNTGNNQNVAAVPQTRDMIVPDSNHRMWNPTQAFLPQTKLSDIESTVVPGYTNPNNIIAGASVNIKLNPKDGCSSVLIDTYTLIKNLLDGRWLVPNCPRKIDCESILLRLQSEIEDK